MQQQVVASVRNFSLNWKEVVDSSMRDKEFYLGDCSVVVVVVVVMTAAVVVVECCRI